MLLSLSDIDPLKNFFDLIHESSQVVEMRLDKEKLSMSLLNQSHVCFYNVEYSNHFFDYYQCNNAESLLVFVDDLYKILKSAKNGDVLHLESNDSHLVCIFENNDNRRVFELPLSEEYSDSSVPPNVQYESEFNVSLKDLEVSCNDLSKIIGTDRFKVNLEEGTLFIVAPTDAMTNYVHEIEVDSNINTSCIVNIQYIQDLQKLKKINDEVTLKIGENLPLSWEINSLDECVKINGLIAPILEQED